ncbi:MAG: Undecaprenyl-phosphate alpha-N-acetylglucosaminyl 1-phosphate transferase [Alphaproteobacteria bacterium MarineAlpha5_Bin6]|nr:MAG: Undecaprenyl-phosphate alpha-N-acetylglucosaminyl 1-phosphate transferase [Alphaproteobacteria bacterium MarineAlpha5_Bin6]
MYIYILIIISNVFLVYFLSFFSKKLNLIDLPDHRKLHSGEIPLIGGLCIYLSILITAFFHEYTYEIKLILFSSGLILLLGLIDDSKQIGVTIRLSAQIITILIVINGGLSIVDLGGYYYFDAFNLGILKFLMTTLAILALTNGINFIDGIDGLASGIIVISLFSIFGYSYFEGNLNNISIIIFLSISLLVFIFFNLEILFLKKIFLGDSGSTTLGFILGFLLIYFTHPEHRNFHPVLAAWCVSLPIFDLVTVVIRRLYRKINPFKPDRRHIHHLLLDKKISPRRVLLIILSTSVTLNIIGGIIYFTLGPLESLIGYVVFMLIYLVSSFAYIRRI